MAARQPLPGRRNFFMRLKIFLPCLLVLALCGGLLLPKKTLQSAALPAITAAPGIDKMPAENFSPAPVKAVVPPAERLANLQSQTASDGVLAVDAIIVALDDGDAEVRLAAREAAVQSGDRNLIPALQVAAERVTDAREKTSLLAAVDFLQLPSLSEATTAN